jgi:hypothetical protein
MTSQDTELRELVGRLEALNRQHAALLEEYRRLLEERAELLARRAELLAAPCGGAAGPAVDEPRAASRRRAPARHAA